MFMDAHYIKQQIHIMPCVHVTPVLQVQWHLVFGIVAKLFIYLIVKFAGFQAAKYVILAIHQ